MPYIYPSDYQPPRWLSGRQHLQTVVPSLLRKIKDVTYQRERIELFDGDFLDLDWTKLPASQLDARAKKLVILSHGLEGSSDRPYIKGMVKIFNAGGYDALAWNMRSCSGQPNRLPRFYHHGATEDLNAVIEHTLQNTDYEEIVLIGFSLGGNMTLKYLGEKHENISKKIKKAVAFSVPCDLPSSVPLLRAKGFNSYYAKRFKNKLVEKIKLKKDILGNDYIENLLANIKTLDDLTDLFFAEVHGFANADDYYRLNSSGPYLNKIRIPTLIVNAANDPMLSDQCSDITLAQNSAYLYLEIPAQGGHCGFAPKEGGSVYWSEKRAWAFCEDK